MTKRNKPATRDHARRRIQSLYSKVLDDVAAHDQDTKASLARTAAACEGPLYLDTDEEPKK